MEKIVWICAECGKKYGNKECGISTWHEGVCDICGKRTFVTEPRDYGYINKEKLFKLTNG
jgi:DNA-directed RNA polymerase subunit RPC12/RpoP